MQVKKKLSINSFLQFKLNTLKNHLPVIWMHAYDEVKFNRTN